MKAAVISKYSSDSLAANSIELIERVFPLKVRGVVSQRFKIGNTAGEYTGCGSSPQRLLCSAGRGALSSNFLPFKGHYSKSFQDYSFKV
jgi:hypothetical protein